MFTIEQVSEIKPHWSEKDCEAWLAKYGNELEMRCGDLLYDKLSLFSDFNYIKRVTASHEATEIWVIANKILENSWHGSIHYETYDPDVQKSHDLVVTGEFPYGLIDGDIDGFSFYIKKNQLEIGKQIHILE